VAPRDNHVNARRHLSGIVVPLLAISLLLTGCQQDSKTQAPEARPVRTMTVEKSQIGEMVSLTGQIQAENEAALAFRNLWANDPKTGRSR
jgi:multidrug efflux pump subunit AcrA (membrane-fusion protein)